MLSLTFNISAESSPNSTIWGSPHDKQIQKKHPQIVEFDEDLAEILKVKDNKSFSTLLLNEKKLYFEMTRVRGQIWPEALLLGINLCLMLVQILSVTQ